MTQSELNEFNQLLLKIELALVDGRKFLAQAQAEFQAEQKQAEMTKKIAENIEEKKDK